MSYSSRESTVYRGPVSDEKWLAEGKINLDLPNNVDVESSSSEEEQDVNTTTTSMMHQAGSLIAPWRKLQKSIKSSLPKILLTLAPSYSRSDIKKRSTPVNIIKELNNLKHDASQTQSVPALPIVIPYGFMQTKSIPHPHEALKLAIHVPGAHGEIYATADSKNVYLWRGSVKLSTFSVSGAKSPDNSCFGLTKWIYIKKWRIIVLATSQLELKILDYNLSELYSTSCIKPVLSMEFIENRDELIVCGVSNIRVWTFARVAENGRSRFIFKSARLEIEDLTPEEWVTASTLCEQSNKLYVACDNHVYVYNYENGQRLDTMRNIHELNITSLVFNESLQYLVTASKDCMIKIWNNRGYVIHELKEHLQSVTGLLRPLGAESNKTIMSCSLDGDVILWDLENGIVINKIDTQQEVLGIGVTKKDSFYYYSKRGVFLFSMSRSWFTFNFTRSSVLELQRLSGYDGASRILCISSDNSLRLLSPLSGHTLITGFPILRNSEPVKTVYDLHTERIFVLLKSGQLAVYGCESNPMCVLSEWELYSGAQDRCNTIELFVPNSAKYAASSSKLEDEDAFLATKTFLLAGLENGQIAHINPDNGHVEAVIQAHVAGVKMLMSDDRFNRVLSCGKDNLIKIWCATLSEKTLLFSLRSTISLSVGSPCHIRMIPYHQRQTKLAVVSNQQFLFVYTLDGEGLVFGAPKTHEHDDDHGKEITSIVGLSSLSIFATSSLDGTVKIWDGEENTLIREIQFQEPVNSVCFNNARGDLIVGLSNQVGLVRMQDYLPYNLLRLAIDLDHRDDALELSIMFDGSIDFWGLYRQMLLSSSSRTAPIWHVLDKPEAERGMAKGNKDPFSILSNEEYVRRKAVIHNRKMRRLFLLKERHAYESAKSFEPVTVFTDVAIPIMNSQDNSRSDLSSRASVRSLRTAESKKKLFNGRKLAKLAGDSRVNDEEEEGEGMSEFVNFRPSFAMGHLRRRSSTIVSDTTKRTTTLDDEESKTSDENEFDTEEGNEAPPSSSPERQESQSSIYSKRFSILQSSERRMSRADLEAIQSIYGDLMEHPSEEESKGLILDKAIGLSMTVDQVQAKIEAEEARAIKNNRKLIHSEDPRLGAGKRNWTKIHRKNIDALGAMPNSVGGGASKNRSSPTGQTPNSSQQKKKVEATVLRTLTPKDESAAVMMKLIAPQAPKIDTSTPMSNFLSEKIQKVRALRLAEKRMKEREEGGNISSKSEGPDINNYLGSRLSLNISKSDTADKSGDSKRSSPPSSSIQAPPIFLEQPLDAPDFAGSLASRSSATISLHDDHSNDKADQEVVENEDQTPEHAGYRTLLNVDSFSGAGAGGSRSRRGSNVGSETSKNRKKLEDVHHLSTKKYEEIYGDYPKGGREEEHDEVEDHQYYTLPELRDKAKQKVKVALKTARKKTPNNPKPPPKYAQRGSTVNKFIAAAINPPAGSSMDDESSEEDSDDDSDEEGSVNSQLYQQAVPNALLKIPATATAPIQPKIKKPLQIQEEKAAKPKKMKPQPPPSVMPKEPSRDELYNPKITVDAQYLRAERETWNLLKMLTEKKQDMVNKEFEALSGTDWFPGMMKKRVTLMNIIKILVRLTKKGGEREKLEACKALLNIYKTFEADIQDPLSTIVLPQLDGTFDESDRVRYIFCKNLAKYRIFNHDVIFCLICRLSDHVEKVRKIAQYSLETLGIDSKDQLKGVMQQLHMIPGDSRNGRNHLDVLLAREKKKEDTVKQVQMEGIKQWLQAMDPKCYLLKEKRPESSENTLCFPPIIHYNQHLKRLKYAHH